jgi:hypothetical protein
MSISNLSSATHLDVNIKSLKVNDHMDISNFNIRNIRDAVSDTDAVNLRQLNSAIANISIGVSAIVNVSMSGNADISSYSLDNTGTILLYDPSNTNRYVKLPLPSQNGMQLTIINVGTGTGIINLCTDNFSTILKSIASHDNGLKCLAYGNRWIFMIV